MLGLRSHVFKGEITQRAFAAKVRALLNRFKQKGSLELQSWEAGAKLSTGAFAFLNSSMLVIAKILFPIGFSIEARNTFRLWSLMCRLEPSS